MRAMLAAASVDPAYGKFIVAVDEDIDPRDLDAVMWAVTFRAQPHRDVQIVGQRSGFIDPSAAPFDAPVAEKAYPQPSGASSLLIDATCKFDYPPVSLPAKEYMLKARTLWEELGLPRLTPRAPWHGYEMGPWPREWAEEAMRAAQGEYRALGELHAAQRKPTA
jgi:4-hydroxy-3-polyprenylbenzoate decarboxylase